MNAFNHYAYGACGEWMFRSMLGIDTDGVEYKQIRVKPEIGECVNWARGHYDSIRGRIANHWQIEGDSFSWQITVPPNTTATEASAGLKFLHQEGDRAVFKLEAGSFQFVSKLPAEEGN